MHDKNEYVVYIRSLKQALNHGLVLKKVHRAIKFNQKAWVKDFFKLMNNTVFGEFMENVRNLRDIKLVTNEARGNYLVSEPNYQITKLFSDNLLAIEMKRTQTIMNKSAYVGLSR